MIPYLSAQAPWFSFIVHIRDAGDVDRAGVGSFLRCFSRDEAEVKAKVQTMSPLIVSEIRFTGSSATGEVVCVCRFPEQMMSADGRRWVLEAVQLAAKRGSKVIGLGGLTAPATGGGLTLRDHIPRGVTLTNGNALTAVIVRDNVIEAVELLGRGRSARVAIIGCTGSVGGAASHLVAAEGFPLTLIGRTRSRVEKTCSALHARYSGSLDDAADADVVVILTSDETARFRPWHAKPGAMVIDCAQPANIPAGDYATFAGHGVTVVEGGLVSIPGYTSTFELTGVRRSVFACLAETYLFSCSGIREHSLGRPTVEQTLKVERLARGRRITALPIAPRWHAQPAAMEVCTT